MYPAFFDRVYESWKPKQLEKFERLLPFFKMHFKPSSSILDLGVGRAWFESFLLDNDLRLGKVVGVDLNELLVKPRLKWIDYRFSKDFNTEERFDFIVCIDSLHLLPDKQIQKFAKPSGFILVSIPNTFLHELPKFKDCEVLHEGFVGEQEKDYFQLLRNA